MKRLSNVLLYMVKKLKKIILRLLEYILQEKIFFYFKIVSL